MTRSRVLILAALGIVALGLYLAWRARPEVQAPATFARLAAAVAGHGASEVLAQVHPDYPFATLWPSQLGEAGAVLGDGNEAQRELVRRGLLYVFMSRRDQSLRMDWRVLSVSREASGDLSARVDLAVHAGDESLLGDSLTGHRFVLRRTSLLGRLEIVGHDPFVIRP